MSQRQLPHLQFHFLLSLCDFSNVVNATAYKQRLAVQHIGPDIFSEIDNKMLTTEIGIPTGDIICLKEGSTVWWNGPDAKQKCSNTDWSSTSHLKSLTHCPQKMVAYEKKYHGGGASCFTGPPMIAGDDDGPEDYNIQYQSAEHGAWLLVPKGFTVCEDDNEDSFFQS